MVKVLVAALAFAASLPAAAACATTKTGDQSWRIACDSGSEAAAAPTTSAHGLPLDARSITIVAEADTGQTFTAAPAGTVAFYLWEPTVGAWARCRSCSEPTITAASERRDHLGAFDVKGYGRLMLIPIGVTLSAGGVTFYVTGSR